MHRRHTKFSMSHIKPRAQTATLLSVVDSYVASRVREIKHEDLLPAATVTVASKRPSASKHPLVPVLLAAAAYAMIHVKAGVFDSVVNVGVHVDTALHADARLGLRRTRLESRVSLRSVHVPPQCPSGRTLAAPQWTPPLKSFNVFRWQ